MVDYAQTIGQAQPDQGAEAAVDERQRGVDAPTDDDFKLHGWSSVAIAVHSVLQFSSPFYLQLRIDGFPTVTIDFRHRQFHWALPVRDLPAMPDFVDIQTEQAQQDAPPLFGHEGRDLDALLWTIALQGFPESAMPWLRSTDQYVLVRWPNYTELESSALQLKMTALLAHFPMSVQGLATASGASEAEARSLVNAFSLMGIVRIVPAAVAAPTPVEATTDPSTRGLFGRLLTRLGF